MLLALNNWAQAANPPGGLASSIRGVKKEHLVITLEYFFSFLSIKTYVEGTH